MVVVVVVVVVVAVLVVVVVVIVCCFSPGTFGTQAARIQKNDNKGFFVCCFCGGGRTYL